MEDLVDLLAEAMRLVGYCVPKATQQEEVGHDHMNIDNC